MRCSGVPHLEEIKEAVLEAPSFNQVEVQPLISSHSIVKPTHQFRPFQQLHPFCQQRPIVEYCKKHNIVVEAYSPLTRGKYFCDKTPVSLSEKANAASATKQHA